MFHNEAVDLVSRDRRDSSDEIFRKARQLTTWHYQQVLEQAASLDLQLGRPLTASPAHGHVELGIGAGAAAVDGVEIESGSPLVRRIGRLSEWPRRGVRSKVRS